MQKGSLLLIWWSLGIGGIETFFIRLVQERARQKLKTKIFLLSTRNQSNQKLVNSAEKYCEVFFIDDIFYFPIIARYCALLSPLRNGRVVELLRDINHIHVGCGYHALLGNRIIKYAKSQIALTVGFYHSMEFAWNKTRLPYFEKINRHFVLEFLPKQNLLLFSEDLVEFFQKNQVDLRGSNTFRIGVIQTHNVKEHKIYTDDSILKIVSVGRLVSFKAYNLWMLDVVAKLSKETNVIYDIYGDGPLRADIEKKILELDISDCVKVRGVIEYEEFKKTVLDYDIFVGSGTSIIEASSLGLCCIVGIENISNPVSYDYFSKSYLYEYNILLKQKELIPVETLIRNFISKSIDEKTRLSEDHQKAAEAFSISKCAENIQSLSQYCQKQYKLKLFGLLYVVSYLTFGVIKKLSKRHLI